MPPPVPVRVMLALELGAGANVLATVTVCDAPGCKVKLDGEKVTPAGMPAKEIAMGELNPFCAAVEMLKVSLEF